jgi:hypothetical protein
MLARSHPLAPFGGYLYLEAAEWRRTLERQIIERDRLNDPNHVGPTPAFTDWVLREQLPQLAAKPWYRKQFEQQLERLQRKLVSLNGDIAAGHLSLRPQADAIAGEIKQLEELLNG